MPADATKRPITVKVCMGSSCYTRGNRVNVEILQEYLRKHRLEEEVRLVGELCQGACRQGPNMEIDGVALHTVDAASLTDVLIQALRDRGKDD